MPRILRSVLALTVACAAFGVATAGNVPERSSCGQTLLVPDSQRELGEVYYVIPGAGTQLTWETDAPLLRAEATCNRVVGYFVAPFELEAGRPPLLAGGLRIPVASLSTGYEQLDANLYGSDVLDRDQFPEILVALVSAGPASSVKSENNRELTTFDLVGELTVKDRTVRFETPARLALLPFAQATQVFSPSDLLMLRASFDVSLEELGITTDSPLGPGFAGKNVHLELYLMCTTIHPRKNFDPRVNDEMYVKQLAFMTRLRDFDDPARAYPAGETFMREIWDDSRMLNELAWAVLTDEQVGRRDLHFVEKAAERANALTDYLDPVYLSTLARLCYEQGDLECAVRWSSKAVDNLEGQPFFVGPPIRAALEEYQALAQAMKQQAKETPAKD